MARCEVCGNDYDKAFHVNVAGANHTFDFRDVTNNGTVTWINGHIGGGDGSVFTNAGTFNDQNASSYSFLSPGSFGFSGTSTFVNTGTYNKTTAGTTTMTSRPGSMTNARGRAVALRSMRTLPSTSRRAAIARHASRIAS